MRFASICLFLALSAKTASAVDRPAWVLPLLPALDEVAEGAPMVAASLRRSEAATARAGALPGLPDPMVMLGVQDFPVSSDPAARATARMPMVGVRQMVPFAGRIAADRRALRAEADLAAALARGTAQDAALVAVGAAVQAAARREEVRAIGRSLEALDILIASVTSRYRTGGTLLADVAMLKVERGDTAAMLREAEAMVAEAAAMWSGVFPRATMPLLDSGPDAAWTPPSTDAIVDASPLVMAAGAERDAAQAMRTSARAAFAPDLELSTAVDVRDTGPVMDIAVAVSLPLWAPWGQEPRLRAASADLGAAEAVWATRRAEVGAQAAAATARWAAARDREDMFRNQIVPYAEAAALSARAAYEAGQVPVVAVIDAIRDEWSNRSRAADVTAERRLWEARILALAGHLVRAASERSGVSK